MSIAKYPRKQPYVGLIASVFVPMVLIWVGSSHMGSYENHGANLVRWDHEYAAHAPEILSKTPLAHLTAAKRRSENGMWPSSAQFALKLLSYSLLPMDVGDVAVLGEQVYVRDGFALDVFDVTSPVAPSFVSAYTTGEYFSPGPIIISGSLALVGYAWSGDLRILDISNPASPTLMGYYNGWGYTGSMDHIGNYVYYASTACGLSIIDISVPSAPKRVNCWSTVDNLNGVVAGDNYLYLSESLGSPNIVHILDVSNPVTPTVLGSYPNSWPLSCLASTGNYLYVGDLQGVDVVDILVPSNPTAVAHYSVDGCSDMEIIDNLMYMAVGQGVLVWDISDPVKPIQVGAATLPSSGNALSVSNQYIFVTDVNVWAFGQKFFGGLAILEMRELTAQMYLPMIAANHLNP